MEKKGKNNCFTVKAVYDSLSLSENGSLNKYIWKGKVPPKIKIFLWLLVNNAILTKDNLRTRNWNGDPRCVFCDDIETVSHLFFTCHVARVIWSIVAKCFGASNIPVDIHHCWQWCDSWLPDGRKFHTWVLGLYVGQFGNVEIRLVLIRS